MTLRTLLGLLSISMTPVVASGAQYTLGPDSLPRDGVPTGTVEERTFEGSRIYPDTVTDYQVYVPARYTGEEPAAVAIFQDGQAYAHLQGQVRAPTVFDNLIHSGEMPVTIGVFVDPARKEAPYDQRAAQYVPLTDAYARFLLEEILPEVGRDYSLVDEASGRVIIGMSDGGLSAFNAAWQRPDAFGKVVSHIGSYTRLDGGSRYPYLIRATRGEPRPTRVFLQDGDADIDLFEGNWTLANLQMAAALRFSRWDHRFELGTGGHDLAHGGSIFPDTMRWIWRDHPDVLGNGSLDDPSPVLGEWDVETNALGNINHAVLNLGVEDGELRATLVDSEAGELEVRWVEYRDGVLAYEYTAPPELNWGKSAVDSLLTWLQVQGDRFQGAVSQGLEAELDLRVEGRKKGTETAP